MLLFAAVASLVLADSAAAHTLSKRGAGKRAWIEAKDAAEAGDWYGARSCGRRSAHTFTCVIWTWTNRNDTYWDAYVNVRFSGYSRRTVAGKWFEQQYFQRSTRPAGGRYLWEWIWIP